MSKNLPYAILKNYDPDDSKPIPQQGKVVLFFEGGVLKARLPDGSVSDVAPEAGTDNPIQPAINPDEVPSVIPAGIDNNQAGDVYAQVSDLESAFAKISNNTSIINSILNALRSANIIEN